MTLPVYDYLLEKLLFHEHPELALAAHFVGYKSDPSELPTTGTAGDWAIVGTTDTVWVWDVESSAWTDTGAHSIVTSVFGRIGPVVAQAGDYSSFYANISHAHSAADITSGNLDVARMPLSGSWGITGDLNITDNSLIPYSLLYIDKVNRQIGINTVPVDKLHVYGDDNSDPADPYSQQRNSVIVDGVLDGDKQFLIAENGVNKWALQTYRNENGAYLYFYNYEYNREPLMMSTGGRIGINKTSNIMNYHSYYINPSTGSINDLVVGGLYDKTYDTMYQISIDTTGATDTFHWRKSLNSGSTWGSWSSSISCSLTFIDIECGVTAKFESITGHNTNDAWEFVAFAQLPQGTMTVNPSMFTEIITTDEYDGIAPNYTDITYNVSNSIITIPTTFIPIGVGSSNKGAIYCGMGHKYNSIFINLINIAVNCSLVVEYWDGSTWTPLDGSMGLNDNTYNLAQSGLISWNKSSLTDWTKTYPPEHIEDGYLLYWLKPNKHNKTQ